MKRDYTNIQDNNNNNFSGGSSSSSTSSSSSNKKIMYSENDELFAALGYTLKSSEMADVALKIEQLENVMSSVRATSSTNPSYLLNPQQQIELEPEPEVEEYSIHYNPSDLATWLQSMISDLNPPIHPSPIYYDSSDLISIPGQNKKPKQTTPPYPLLPETVSILLDAQENGIRLVHTLTACAEAVHNQNLPLSESLIQNIGCLAITQSSTSLRKVATYFAEALARRIYKIPQSHSPYHLTDLLQSHFYETCPYLKFAHFTANQAILEAFNGKNVVHVIDFSLKQGLQWPALLQALALRPGGPPRFRLTGIGPPDGDSDDNNVDKLQEVGWKLAQLAESVNIEFEFRGFVANSLADLDYEMFGFREGETIAVNSIFELHPLLARVNGIEKVLENVKMLKPEIVTVVEVEGNHNTDVFLDRFNESLHYYSTVFDSLESAGGNNGSEEDRVMSEVYLGRQICNVVACEGIDRVERHETLGQWRGRFGLAGFEKVSLGSNAFKQASMLLALFAGGDGYRVEENEGCLMLGWHTRNLIATSAWKVIARK